MTTEQRLSPRPHDLVRIDPGSLLTGAEPGWVAVSLAAAPWVVVRRAAPSPGMVAVGVRGTTRAQRHALEIPRTSIAALARPEELRAPVRDRLALTPAITWLRRCTPLLDEAGHPWGPTGSVGFELATGLRATTPTSDLDLLVRVDHMPSAAWADALHLRLSASGTRVDCQLETPGGGIALAELAGDADPILVRTGHGPELRPRERAPS